jgi:uncharacterized membrane protein
MLMASRSGNPQAVAVTARNVVLADWIFTTPAIAIQFVTGIWLMKLLHYPFTSTWFIVVISLFVFIGCCWVPVVFIQYRLKNIVEGQERDDVLDARFRRLMALWTALGIPAFLGIAIMFWLMVFKPLGVI